MNNTFYSMVMGQAATGREVIGTTAKVIPDNKIYEVTAINGGENGDEITLTEVLPEDSEETADVITITEANAAVAHYVQNPNGRPVVDATLKDGKLSFASTSVSIGTLPLTKVLGAVEGQILLAAKADKDGFVNLYAYDIQLDKFTDLETTVVDTVKVVDLGEVGTALVINDIRKVDLVDDKGNKTGEADVAYDCSFAMITGGTSLSIDTYAGKSFDAPIDNIKVVNQGENNFVVVTSSKKTDDEGHLVTAEKPMLRIYSAYRNCVDSKLATIFVKNAAAEVVIGGAHSEVTTVIDSDAIIIKNSRGLVVVNDAEVVKAMAGFKFFCGVAGSKSDRDENVTTWTFANDKKEVKSFTQTVTDRGILFKMA